MKDLTKALKCEGLDEESWKRSRLERAAKLAALPECNVSEMSMKRQMININSNRDKLEEALREINECISNLHCDLFSRIFYTKLSKL